MAKSKIVSVLLSVVIAFALWLYVITVVSPGSEETFYDIPVSLQGESLLEERGLIITSEDIPTVDLTLSGNRTDLNNLNKSNITLIVDLSKVYEAGTHKLSYTPIYPGNIANDAIRETNRNPGQITLSFEQKITKPVPVNVKYKGKVLDGFIADTENPELKNADTLIDSVEISGPASVVSQITQALIEVDLTDRNASFVEAYRFTLCDADGEPVDAAQIQTNIAEVQLTLYIQKLKEIPLELTIIDGGGATKNNSTIKIEPKTIQVSGSESVLETLESINLGTVDLGTLTSDTEKTFTITLPAGVTNRSGLTEATVTVKFPELRTKTLTITNITPVNVPEEMVAEIINQALEVTVRGPKTLVEKMTADNITVTVDFTNVQVGTTTVKATVTMGTGFTRVGTIKGPYSVSVTLREATEDDAKSTG